MSLFRSVKEVGKNIYKASLNLHKLVYVLILVWKEIQKPFKKKVANPANWNRIFINLESIYNNVLVNYIAFIEEV